MPSPLSAINVGRSWVIVLEAVRWSACRHHLLVATGLSPGKSVARHKTKGKTTKGQKEGEKRIWEKYKIHIVTYKYPQKNKMDSN